MKKDITESDMRKIGDLLSIQYEAATEAYKIAVRCLRIDSREFKSICSAGNKISKAYITMRLKAEIILDNNEVQNHFSVRQPCIFN